MVDVFAPRPLTGNPVAVVLDADGLDTGTMKAIAREFNQSETTFLLRPTDARAHCRLRSFTPAGEEVGGAGHNALGAWLWLISSGSLPESQTSYIQEIGDELLPVEAHRGARGLEVTMTQSPAVAGNYLPDHDRAKLAQALGIDESHLANSRPRVISTGAGHLLTELWSRAVVDAAAPNSTLLQSCLRGVGAEGCYVYSLDGETDAYARFFNPIMGISEDPATGTAAGPLATRLVEDGVHNPAVVLVVEQGTALGRQSLIRADASSERPRVTGSGVVSAEGTLHLDGTPL